MLSGYKTYITAGLMLLVGVAKVAGFPIPGFDVDPGALIGPALGLIFARLGATAEGKKAVIAFAFAAAAAALVLSGAANATDVLPVKARALPAPGYPVGCGLFWGADTQGEGGGVSGAPVGTTTLGGEIGVLAGYTCPLANDGSAGWFVEGDFNFQNLNGTTNGFALTGPASFEQRMAVFGGIDKILSVFPSLNLPAFPSTPLLPAGVTAGPAQVYMFGAVHEQDVSAQFGLSSNRDWLISPGVGFGTLTRWSNGLVVDVWIENQFRSSGMAVGPSKVALKDMIRAGLAFKY